MSVLKIRKSDGTYSSVNAIQGKSAYEIALKNGFVGTEEEWLASMKYDDTKLVSKIETLTAIDDTKVDKENPVMTGTTLSFARKSGSTVGANSISMGVESRATGDNTVAIGYNAQASGKESTAIGTSNTASGDYSVALGRSCTASNEYSFATGCWTSNNGIASTTLGNGSYISQGWGAMSSGILTKAKGLGQHVFGINNIEDPATVSNYSDKSTYLMIVGNGDTGGNKSNAYTLDWGGNGWFAGKLTVGAKPVNDMDVATKNYTDTAITNAIANAQRITYRGNVGSDWAYFPLANFVVDNGGNYGNITISGRLGKWESFGAASFEIMLLNRSGAFDGNTITSTVSAVGEVEAALSVADIVIYKQEDRTAKAYIKAKSYAIWDLEYKEYQHTIVYDGSSSTTEPAGTLIWSLSSANKTILNSLGVLSQTGTPTSDNDLVNKAYTDSTYGLKDNPVFTGTTFSFGRQSDSTTGKNSIAIGASTIASGNYSTAVGYDSTATGDYSAAIGYGSVASGQESVALGNGNNSSGKFSFTVGKGNQAKNEYSIAMGCWNTSEAIMGTALGNAAVTKKGYGAFSSGVLTTATGMGQHVFGVNNIVDEDPVDETTFAKNIIIVGNGEIGGEKSNAYTLDKDGNGWFAGKVTAGAAPTEDMDLTTKKYVTDTYLTKSSAKSSYYGVSNGTLNIDELYDGKLYMIKNGANLPCGSQYGVVLGSPYRSVSGNKKPDFGAQILLPNGDDITHPNSMFYRTSLGDSWNEWQEVATKSDLENLPTAITTSIIDQAFIDAGL